MQATLCSVGTTEAHVHAGRGVVEADKGVAVQVRGGAVGGLACGYVAVGALDAVKVCAEEVVGQILVRAVVLVGMWSGGDRGWAYPAGHVLLHLNLMDNVALAVEVDTALRGACQRALAAVVLFEKGERVAAGDYAGALVVEELGPVALEDGHIVAEADKGDAGSKTAKRAANLLGCGDEQADVARRRCGGKRLTTTMRSFWTCEGVACPLVSWLTVRPLAWPLMAAMVQKLGCVVQGLLGRGRRWERHW